MAKHIHAELIKAWADNPDLTFQCRVPSAGRLHNEWTDIKRGEELLWIPSIEYRIKPEPKPDIEKLVLFDINNDSGGMQVKVQWNSLANAYAYLNLYKNAVKFTLDGETKQIKKVELL